MSARRIRFTVGACLLSAGLLTGAGTASGHEHLAKTEVVIDTAGPSGVAGKLETSRESCVEGREVTLFRQGQRIDTVKTNDDGDWVVPIGSFQPGFYHAEVSERRGRRTGKRKRRHRHGCRRGRSPTTQL